jgi:2-keto-4-pentenoate hydratase
MNGAQQATGGGANVLDSPLLAFAHLAEVLKRQSRFVPVQAGEIVTTGTLTLLLPVAAGATWTATLCGLGVAGLSTTFV